MILNRYFFKLSFKSFIVSMISLVALIQLADLFTVLWPKIDEGVLPQQLWKASLLNIPTSIKQSIVFAILFSGAYSLGSFATTGELLAARSCGVSTFTLIKPFIIMSFICALIQTLTIDPVSNFNNRRSKLIATQGLQSREAFSYRWDKGFFFSERYSLSGKTFYNITIVEIDDDGRLTRRVNAQTAVWQNDGWQLGDVRIFYPQSQAYYYQQYRYTNDIDPTILDQVNAPPADMTMLELINNIAFLKQNNIPTNSEEIVYYRRFSDPWQILLVSFFLLFTVQTRKNGLLNSLLQSIILAIIFFVIQMLFTIAAEGNRIPPASAAFGPIVLMSIGLIIYQTAKKLSYRLFSTIRTKL